MSGRNLKPLLFIAAVVAAGYYAYSAFLVQNGPAEGAMGNAMSVNVAQVVEQDVQQWREFSGRLVAVDSAMIRPRVAGTIDKIHFQEGQWVKKDQPLFTIDQKPYAASLQSAQARATLAEAELARAKSLIADKAIPQREYDQRRNDAEVARADLTRARLDYDYTIIKSPIAGRVSRAEVTVGNLVDGGGNAPMLTSVVSNTPIYADFDVDEQTFVRFMQSVSTQPEQIQKIPVQLELPGNASKIYEGRVQSFDNQLNTTSGTIRVRTVFDNKDGAFIPGLFARVRMADAVPAKSLLIAERAMGTDQSKKFVIVVDDKGITERREIMPGGMANGLLIIDSGLKAGEKIIVDGMQRVFTPGQPVTPVLVNMDGTPVAEDSAKTPDTPKEKKAVE